LRVTSRGLGDVYKRQLMPKEIRLNLDERSEYHYLHSILRLEEYLYSFEEQEKRRTQYPFHQKSF
jgi:hypothetical protein